MLRTLQVCLFALLVSFINSVIVLGDDLADGADHALPNKEGLILWLDATRPEALLDDSASPVAKSGAPIAAWLDASPSKLRLEQKAAVSQPKLAIDEESRTVRFNGDKTFLQGSLPRSQKELTVFVV